MTAGRLRHRLRFEKHAVVDDGAGNEQSGEWMTVYGPAEAGIDPLRGGESVMAARLGGTQPVIVTVRACAATLAITPDGHRAVDTRTGTVYNIRTNTEARDDQNMREMVCDAGVAT
jgi:head-tail adaptor